MTTHAAAVPEAALPPLTEGPYRKRIGLISIVACLGGAQEAFGTGRSQAAAQEAQEEEAGPGSRAGPGSGREHP